MLLLPHPPRRAHLRAFAIVAGIAAGALVGLVAALLGAGAPLSLASMAAAAAPAYIGWVRPAAVEPFYRRWNRLARTVAARARTVLLRVWYHTVVTAAGRADTTMDLRRDGSPPSWSLRATLQPSAYRSMDWIAGDVRPKTGWLPRLTAWCFRAHREWALALVPMIVALAALDFERRRQAPPTNIYTLY